jgi:CBS domain-containing protein
MRRPEPQALIEAANFFDFRRVGGELSLEPLDELFREASKHGLFLAHMAKNALDFRPPLGLFHRIREQAEGVDLKKGGIIPIVSLGRLHALEAGILVRGTLDRLDAAAAAGRISRDGAENLGEAFRFLLRLRLEDQLEAKRAGQPVDNQVRLANLSPLERRHLKDTFLAVREMQEALAMRYKTDLIG